jgi:hypothetical protein
LIKQPRNVLAANFGIPDIGNGSLVVEAKTIDPRAKLDEPKPEHVFQVQAQIGLIRELTPYQPEFALISYANASFLDDIVEFAIRFDPVVFANAKRRAARILTAHAASELKPEGWIASGHECEFCSFTKACGIVRHAMPTRPLAAPLDPQFLAEISDLAREAQQRRAAVDAATIGLRAIEHEIKERLHAKGVRQVVGDGVTVTWSLVRGRPAYDMKRIREALAAMTGGDLAEYETVGDPTDRLVIRTTTQFRAAA